MKLPTILIITSQLFFLKAVFSLYTQGGGNIQMVNLGTVDGKSFFADNTSRTWVEAKKSCEDFGLKLAKITTTAQVAFLKSHYNATTFTGAHWIAARDSRKPRALSWDDTETEPANLTSITWTNNVASYLICGYFTLTASNNYLYLYPCANGLKTLCET